MHSETELTKTIGDTPSSVQEVVLVDCPDEVGLIHRITGVLATHQWNIVRNQEFVDAEASHFFFALKCRPRLVARRRAWMTSEVHSLMSCLPQQMFELCCVNRGVSSFARLGNHTV